MAKHPATEPVVAEIKTSVRITKNGVHDGLGDGMHKHMAGDVVELPREVADILIGRGLAQPADGSSYAKAKARSKEIEEKARQNANASVARARMNTGFDDMPKELRELSHEHGDAIYELWQDGNSAEDIIKAYTRH